MLVLSEINIYPIKSLGGFSVPAAKVERRGLENDRRFMLADPQGRFVSQREIAALTQLGTAISGETLVVFLKKSPGEKIEIPLRPAVRGLERKITTIWQSSVEAAVMPPEFGRWFSEKLGQPLELVFFPDDAHRATSADFAPGFEVSFADGYPILILGQATLDHLNSLLAEPLPMNRFRPNLVFTGGQPHEEDGFRDFKIGNTLFRGVKPCGRCIVPTTDQETGRRAAEPMQTLATYRKQGKSINFGENVVWLGGENDRVRVGDGLLLVSRKEA